MRVNFFVTCLALVSPTLIVGCGAEGGAAFTMLTKPGALGSTSNSEGYREGVLGDSVEDSGATDAATLSDVDAAQAGSDPSENQDSSFSDADLKVADEVQSKQVSLASERAREGGKGDDFDSRSKGDGGSDSALELNLDMHTQSLGHSKSDSAAKPQTGAASGALIGSCGHDQTNSQLAPSVSSLWSPNGKMVPVSIIGEQSASCFIFEITDNETNLAEDSVITGDLTAQLRATRQGSNLSGRVYRIEMECSNANGDVSYPTLEVRVCHDRRKK